MEYNNQIDLSDLEAQLEADFGENKKNTYEYNEENHAKVQSKIADLRELQHEPSPHRKFDRINAWMGNFEEFKIYQDASFEEIVEVLEQMENLKDFVLEYTKVLSSERNRINQVETYIK